MLLRIRESLALILIGLLPFHAFFVTVGTKLIAGFGHAPLTMLALWKEALLAIILIIAFLEWLKRPKSDMSRWAFDDTDILIVGLVIFSVIITAITHSDWKLYLFGFKYDFVPIIAFFALRRVGWSKEFFARSFKILISVGSLIALYGIATMFLPQKFFVWLGYSDLHSLYLPDAPLAAFQQIESLGIRRMQSVMSGPNQLGLWLLIPWSIVLVRLVARRKSQVERQLSIAALLLIGSAIVLTFSRSAWIAAAIITVVALYSLQSRKKFKQSIVRLGAVAIGLLLLLLILKPDAITRIASTRDHLIRPLEATRIMRENPFGLGLGTAGPASNRVSDACVHLEAGADSSWAADRPDLCVFVGGVQVQPPLIYGELRLAGQPVGRVCKCPLLPENWYLQIGVELGLIGFAMFVTVIMFVLRALRIRDDNKEIFLIFLGISIAALFLHAWEDSAVAYTVWVMIAAAVGWESWKKNG
ncbi:hypothetical protein KKC44_03260 [Patescibacteria group bacterium]|nr:hypothetical protein [Patescibacteria group bacterium]